MKKTANKTKREGKSTTHIKKSKKSNKSKRATNKPTRNSKTFKKTYLSKKQRALKQLQNAIKTHILNIIRAHKTKRKLAGGGSCSQVGAGGGNPEQDQNALVGGGRLGADAIANSIAAFFEWLQNLIASIFGRKPKNNTNMKKANSEQGNDIYRGGPPEVASSLTEALLGTATEEDIEETVNTAVNSISSKKNARDFFRVLLEGKGYKPPEYILQKN